VGAMGIRFVGSWIPVIEIPVSDPFTTQKMSLKKTNKIAENDKFSSA